MCYGEACFGYMLIVVIIGFAGLIYLSLKSRKSFLEENVQLTADQIWKEVSGRATKDNFSKSDLIFGIWQDKSSTTPVLLVKDQKNEVIARVEFTKARRQWKILIGKEIYFVDFPLTWNRTALLRAADNKSILASYLKMNIFGKHQFEIPEYGTLASERPYFSLRLIFDYRSNHNLVGTIQELSPRRQIGRLAILPSSLPLHLRVFILAV